jgi:hypothetical protein
MLVTYIKLMFFIFNVFNNINPTWYKCDPLYIVLKLSAAGMGGGVGTYIFKLVILKRSAYTLKRFAKIPIHFWSTKSRKWDGI